MATRKNGARRARKCMGAPRFRLAAGQAGRGTDARANSGHSCSLCQALTNCERQPDLRVAAGRRRARPIVRRARGRRGRRPRAQPGRPRGRRRGPRAPPGPWTRTRAWSATSRASPTCCSTRTTAALVSSAMRRTMGSSCSTMTGARPMLISSMSSTRGFCTSARATASICCSPPESAPAATFHRRSQRGEQVDMRVGRLAAVPVRRRGSLDGQRGEQRAVVGHEHDAGLAGCAGRPLVSDSPVDEHVAGLAWAETGKGGQQRRLARAVRAEHGGDRALRRRRGRRRVRR